MNKILKYGKIITCNSKNDIISGDILIESGKITAVGADPHISDKSQDAEIIDCRDKYIMPGIINSHTHIAFDPDKSMVGLSRTPPLMAIAAARNAEILLKSGVTYCRDLGSPGGVDFGVRDACRSGLVLGADVLASGKCITMTGGHGWFMGVECDGPDEVRKGVREQLKAGADVIKIMGTGGHSTPGVHPKDMQFTPEELKAAAEAAHYARKKIASHTNGAQGIYNAVIADIDSIEHCEFFPDDDQVLVDKAINKMVEKGTYYVPTLCTWFKEYPREYGYFGPVDESYLDKPVVRQPDCENHPNTPREYMTMRQVVENGKRLYDAGTKIVMGTDAGLKWTYFDRYPFEMKLMGLIGMSPMEVLISATRTAAELLGIDKNYGTIEDGKFADLLILNKSPLDDMDSFYDLCQVYKKGEPVL